MVEFDEFLNLTPEQVINFIKSDRLLVPSEETIYESVLAWVKFDENIRQEYLSQLMEFVRLPLLSQDYLVQRVEQETLLRDNLQCNNLIIEALKYHLIKNDPRLLYGFISPRVHPRRYVKEKFVF